MNGQIQISNCNNTITFIRWKWSASKFGYWCSINFELLFVKRTYTFFVNMLWIYEQVNKAIFQQISIRLKNITFFLHPCSVAISFGQRGNDARFSECADCRQAWVCKLTHIFGIFFCRICKQTIIPTIYWLAKITHKCCNLTLKSVSPSNGDQSWRVLSNA